MYRLEGESKIWVRLRVCNLSIQLVEVFQGHSQMHRKWKKDRCKKIHANYLASCSEKEQNRIYIWRAGAKLILLLSDVTHADDLLLYIFTLPTGIKQSLGTRRIQRHVHVFGALSMRFIHRDGWQASPFVLSSIRTQIWVMPITLPIYLTHQAIRPSAGRCETATSATVQSSVQSYSADLAARPPLPWAKGGSWQWQRVRSVEGDECPLLPGPHHRDMLAGLQGGEGGFVSPALCAPHAEQLTDAQSWGYRAAPQVLLVGNRGGGQSQGVSRWAHPMTFCYSHPVWATHRWQTS